MSNPLQGKVTPSEFNAYKAETASQLTTKTENYNVNEINISDVAYLNSWSRVVTDGIPITKRGKIVVTLKPYGTTIRVQHVRPRVVTLSKVDIVKTIEFTNVTSGKVTSLLCDFDIRGDGNDYIAVCGCYFENVEKHGFRTLIATYDPELTYYTVSGSFYTMDMSATMGFYTEVVSIDESYELNPMNGLKGVCFGDSITQFGAYPDTICVYTGGYFANVGVGGTRLAYDNYTNYNELSFVRLTTAIKNNSWTAVDSAVTNIANADVAENIAKLKTLDFSGIDTLTIAYGTNDWWAGIPIDDVENPLSESTLLGALRLSVGNLLQVNPLLKIYVFTPAYRSRYNVDDGQDSDNHPNATTTLYLYEYCDAIVDECKKLHIPCKNMYYTSGVNSYTASTYLVDGLHRTAIGYELLGKQYAKFILDN